MNPKTELLTPQNAALILIAPTCLSGPAAFRQPGRSVDYFSCWTT